MINMEFRPLFITLLLLMASCNGKFKATVVFTTKKTLAQNATPTLLHNPNYCQNLHKNSTHTNIALSHPTTTSTLSPPPRP